MSKPLAEMTEKQIRDEIFSGDSDREGACMEELAKRGDVKRVVRSEVNADNEEK